MLESFLSSFLSDWAVDAVVDSIKTIPFLFLVFLFIELFEHFWANKVKNFILLSKKQGPLIGSVAASIPQCGFSVVASTLYSEKYITRGTIIAVYLATSDEAIPVLLMYPEYFSYIIPLILIKLLIAVPVGYLVDLIFKSDETKEKHHHEHDDDEELHVEGCCRHDITVHRKRDFLIHPIKHTIGIFAFILVLTLLLNWILEIVDFQNLALFKTNFKFLTPLITAILGLIPNCAISVGLVLMFIKGTITFGALISGLMTSAGIGLLVLLKHNKNMKDTAFILSFLVAVGYFVGILVQTLS